LGATIPRHAMGAWAVWSSLADRPDPPENSRRDDGSHRDSCIGRSSGCSSLSRRRSHFPGDSGPSAPPPI